MSDHRDDPAVLQNIANLGRLARMHGTTKIAAILDQVEAGSLPEFTLAATFALAAGTPWPYYTRTLRCDAESCASGLGSRRLFTPSVHTFYSHLSVHTSATSCSRFTSASTASLPARTV